MGFFKSLKGDYSTTHSEALNSPPAPAPACERIYRPPPGPPPSHQSQNVSSHGSPPGGNQYTPPTGPPPGWQETPSEIPTALSDADEEPPPYQYVLLESIFPLADQALSVVACLGSV